MTTLTVADIYVCTSWTQLHAAGNSYTQLNGSSKGAASAFTRTANWQPGGTIEFPVDAQPVGLRSGGMTTTDEPLAELRRGVLSMRSTYGGADTGADLRAEMQDEHSALQALLNPHVGQFLLRFDRPNRSGTTLSRLLVCRVTSVQEWAPPGDRQDPEAIVLNFGIDVLYPLYVTRTATETTYTGVGTSFSSNTISNDGHSNRLGLVVEITAKTGSPTLVTLENTTTGHTLLWTIATTATANDRLSWFGDDPRTVQLTTTNASHLGTSAANASPVLALGSNTVKLKVNSGTVDAKIYTADEFLTL